jgi:hypothetical protein
MTDNIHKYSSEMPYEQLLHHLDCDESDQSDLSELVETDTPVRKRCGWWWCSNSLSGSLEPL